MAQLFPQWSNTVVRIAFVALLALPVAVPAALMIAVRTPYQTGEGVYREQPVPFSHEHHAGNLNIDCRYCHHTVEQSTFSGMPATQVCMTCHSQLWTDADMLAPVRRSLAFQEPLRWRRINKLADYVYFDHSIHVNKGVGCETCHGRIDTMPLTYPTEGFQMQFCLECHRNPERYLRPRSEITTMGWEPPVPQHQLGTRLLETFQIHKEQLTDCSICHR
ncbi:cytochrome c3 family protein [Proteobacteria bacterium 005FR1]|nr:cytochrome c3 family protein [Proteobacteria bacterium 005FR1]